MMQSTRILVVGSANMDLVARVERLPLAGQTIQGTAFMTALGGKGANQAVAAARLGATVCFAGCVGDDPFGALQRNAMETEGIDTSCLRTYSESPTGVAVILVESSGQNVIVITPGANGGVTPQDMETMLPVFESVDVLLCQLETPLDAVEAALRQARRCGVFSILDTGGAGVVPQEMLALADLVSPNETEAELLTGVRVTDVDSGRRAAQCLRDMGVRHVVMKLGERGSLYLGGEEVYAPAFPVDAVDTTAAGDAFTAALGVVWLRMPVADALRFANGAGALAATAPGAQPSMPGLDGLTAFLNRFNPSS